MFYCRQVNFDQIAKQYLIFYVRFQEPQKFFVNFASFSYASVFFFQNGVTTYLPSIQIPFTPSNFSFRIFILNTECL